MSVQDIVTPLSMTVLQWCQRNRERMSPHVEIITVSDVVYVFLAVDVPAAESADHPADASVRASLPEECRVVLCVCICLLTGVRRRIY